MVIFHSYVKLPEGNMTFQGWNMFSIVYRLFFVNLNLQSTIQTQLFIQDPRNPSAWRKCETPDSRHPGREKAKTWDFFAQLSIGRQNHSSTMNIHHSSTMIPVRENSEVVIKFTQTNGYIYIMVWNHQPAIHPPWTSRLPHHFCGRHCSAMVLYRCLIGLDFPSDDGKWTWRIQTVPSSSINMTNKSILNHWLKFRLYR